ncbi:hypothetical protein LC607_32925 [Nostoc sp. CHAB 5824]|nr:hypothetical protein [Nostoc sp. CHAB 5824]
MGLVFVIRKESRVGVARRRHRLLYKSSRIQKWQMFSESDRRRLASNWQVQNEFLSHLANHIYECESLTSQDFSRIAELNAQYADLPADFSDLSLVAISERLNVAAIATLDKDFDIYRRYRNQPFERVFYP